MTKRIISAINVTPLVFYAGGGLGTPIAQVTIQMSSGLFSTNTGTLSITGPNAADFLAPRLNASGSYTLLSAITIPATWNPLISLTATQSNVLSPVTAGPYSFSPTLLPSPPPPPPPPPPPAVSLDGAALLVGDPGSLATAAGTWTFGATLGAGGNSILLNNQPAAGGSAIELQVNNDGKLYAKNNQGAWFVWGGSGWLIQTAPPVVVAFSYIPYTDPAGIAWPSGTFPPNIPLGTPIAIIRGVRSDGLPYTKQFQFALPNLNGAGVYSFTMNVDHTATLRVNPAGPGVGSVPSIEHVTMVPSL